MPATTLISLQSRSKSETSETESSRCWCRFHPAGQSDAEELEVLGHGVQNPSKSFAAQLSGWPRLSFLLVDACRRSTSFASDAGSRPARVSALAMEMTWASRSLMARPYWTRTRRLASVRGTRVPSLPVWTTNSPIPVVVNGLNTVTNPISGTQQFFRLSQ